LLVENSTIYFPELDEEINSGLLTAFTCRIGLRKEESSSVNLCGNDDQTPDVILIFNNNIDKIIELYAEMLMH